MSSLHVWYNDYEWIVANDIDDVYAIWSEQTGGSRADFDDECWNVLPDDHVMAIWSDEPPDDRCSCRDRAAVYKATVDAYNDACRRYADLIHRSGGRCPRLPPAPQPKDSPGPNGHYVNCPVGHPRKTCAEWIQQNGRGYLCSTEY